MVVIQIKTSNEHDTFLYETTCDTLNDSLVRDLVKVWNLRIRLRQLAGGLRELAEYGPMKHPDKAGIDEIQEKYNNEHVEKGEYYKADPTGIRNGNGVGPQLSETMNRVADDLESILDKVGTLISSYVYYLMFFLSFARTMFPGKLLCHWVFCRKSWIWLVAPQ